jgi:energy-coupling factor transport system ATP-binding protein
MVANTCFDEIAFGLRLRGMPASEVERRSMEMLEKFRLAHVRDRHPLALSMGQMRQLSVAATLVLEPDAFILDEPMQGLDRETRELVMGILREAARQGTTIIVVTHDMRTVADYADHTVLINQGNIAYSGNTRRFFGDFLGEREHVTQAIVAPPVTQLAGRLSDLGISPYTLTVPEFCRQVRSSGGLS